MFKVGEYFEDDAKSIASYLRDAGFKVDIKGLVVARTDFTACLQGKISEMKERNKLKLKHESLLAAIKATVEKATTEEGFRDLFLTELDPDGGIRGTGSNWKGVLLKKWMKKPERTSENHSQGISSHWILQRMSLISTI
jgi:hypothetical protein